MPGLDVADLLVAVVPFADVADLLVAIVQSANVADLLVAIVRDTASVTLLDVAHSVLYAKGQTLTLSTRSLTMSSGSSSLVNLVPQLNGENSPFWAKQMRVWLMSQGKWSVISDQIGHAANETFERTVTGPSATAGGTPTSMQTTLPVMLVDDPALRLSEEYVDHLQQTATWTAMDTEVQGTILLCCIPAISDKIADEDCAYDMWAQLLYQYGQPGTAGIYNVFQLFMNSSIPVRGNPLQSIEKIEQHVRRLKELGVEIPSFIHTMVLLTKLPPYMKFVSQLAQSMSVDEMSPEDVKARALNAYQAEIGSSKVQNKGKDNAGKITSVRRNNGAPSFQQQRGGRGGRTQQRNNQEFVEDRSARGNGGSAHFMGENRGPAHATVAGTRAVSPSDGALAASGSQQQGAAAPIPVSPVASGAATGH